MKVLKATKVFRGTSGKVLTVRPDMYIEPIPDVFMVQVEVEKDQVFTLPTPDLTAPYTDTFLEVFSVYNGTRINYNENSGGNNQPTLTMSLSANTDYYIKISSTTNDKGFFGLQIIGADGGNATPEEGVIVTNAGTTLHNQYLIQGGYIWYKFRTGAAGSYTMKTVQSVAGYYNYNVDFGDGVSVSNITTYNSASRIHTYTKAGTYVIKITGTLPAWSVNNDASIKLSITRCISWGEVGLRRIDFYGCTAMTNLPEQIGKLHTVVAPYSFVNFCRDCTSLVAIPYGTFYSQDGVSNIDTIHSFSYAFYNCTALRSIHSDTFKCVSNTADFSFTFTNNTKLTTLPSKLFKNCYKVTTFAHCFENDVLINNLPVDLFYRDMQDINYSNISVSNMDYVFYNCDGITTLPSGIFSSPQADNLGKNPVKISSIVCGFASCQLINNLPSFLLHNQTSLTSAVGIFSYCPTLTTITESMFEGCISLTTLGSYGYYNSQYNYGIAGQSLNVVTVETNVFKECTAVMTAAYLFYNCPIVNLADGIFEDFINVTTLNSAFVGSRFSSVNANLFTYCIKLTTIGTCFQSNINLITVPESLLFTNTELNDVSYLFYNCTSFNYIPAQLFRYNSKLLYFQYTFSTTIVSKIPCMVIDNIEYGLFHFNTLANNFQNTFNNTKLANSYAPFVPAIHPKTFSNNSAITSFYACFGSISTLESTSEYPISDQLFAGCPSVTDFSYVFSNNTHVNFKFIPADLFKYNTNVSNFNYTFSSTNVDNIPATLFSTCSRVSSFTRTFYATKISSIPAALFDVPGSSVQNFFGIFESCTFLTSIPTDLFKYNINVTDMSNVFNSTGITSYPVDLFRYNVLVTTFSYVFGNCNDLLYTVDGTFKYNLLVTAFNHAFYSCEKLQITKNIFADDADKTTRFLNKFITFNNCFYRTSYNNGNIGIAPDLWNYTFNFTPVKTNCLGGSGNSLTSLSNYADIPSVWRT